MATVNTKSGRPTIQLLETPVVTGKVSVAFRMRGRGSPQAYVLWGTKDEAGFAATRRAITEVDAGEGWHDYQVEISPTSPMRMLRIDGSLTPTQLEFAWIKLIGADGKTVAAWNFGEKTP